MNSGALFCDVGGFGLEFEPQLRRRSLPGPARSRDRDGRLSLSKMMAIVIASQLGHYRDLKESYSACQTEARFGHEREAGVTL